ncbi:uncharacterized protein UV8b_04691 [Ustilaginoidea virens]|uniref:Transcription initiation factor TFIID subunit 8 n=1 Tax=Ustilaginoidea virens TaxID=1159556 RepID=A0A8E5HRS1_USTVR|nr:uncharacterized protein UV8b_04691 [Ustilaginoidea virens]QUC20450.1 hypothetical protein UV8b_04691 [Ustilaginoidea virens]
MSSKRSLPPSLSESPDVSSKKPKLGPAHNDHPGPDRAISIIAEKIGSIVAAEIGDEIAARKSLAPTHHANARAGIQRSIAMVLRHDGFASSTPEAMESFTGLVETYLASFIQECKRFALSSRRDHPNPTDFEAALRRFNLPISSLKPHLKNPIHVNQLVPTYDNVHVAEEDAYTTLPLLGPELSGQADKDARKYIPPSFPDFPSRHTYKFTPQEDTSVRDSKKIREEAARTAQQGEDALRRLVRASKMRKQKEAKSLVEIDDQGKERFRLWESTMRRFTGADPRIENTNQAEIADHSMIVNGDAMFARKEVSRLGKRSAPLPHSTVK